MLQTALKGLINLFGSPFDEECHFLKGLKQIFIQLPFSILCLIFIPFSLAGNLICDTLGMLIDPEDYSAFRRHLHERELEEIEGVIFPWRPFAPKTLLTDAAHLCFK